MDVDNHVNHCVSVAKNLINIIGDLRVDNELNDLTDNTCERILDHVATKARAAFMSSHGCPDPAPIAEEMPVITVDLNLSVKELIQEAYNTTKTEEFFDAIRSVVGEPDALIYAVKMWHKDHVSDIVKEFLLEYANILYGKRMQEVNMNIEL